MKLLRAFGSLWFAAVLLMLCVVAMASATVFESMHGTEQALHEFYLSRWFELLLTLLGINVLAAMLARLPFTRHHVGFVVTHVSIVIILLGAIVTKLWGIDGQIGVYEGESVAEFTVREDTLVALSRVDGSKAEIDLAASAFSGFHIVQNPPAPALALGTLTGRVEWYMPDGEWSEQALDDGRRVEAFEPVEPIRESRNPGIFVRFHAGDEEHTLWLSKFRPADVTLAGVPYQLLYGNKSIPLAFELRLDRFQIVRYPGTGRPRSFESTITINDRARGGAQTRVVSMNHPVKYGGWTLYQSSYREGRRMASFLSVSRDPGQPIVFAGYVMLMIGMTWVLVNRVAMHRNVSRADASVGVERALPTTAPPLSHGTRSGSNHRAAPGRPQADRTLAPTRPSPLKQRKEPTK